MRTVWSVAAVQTVEWITDAEILDPFKITIRSRHLDLDLKNEDIPDAIVPADPDRECRRRKRKLVRIAIKISCFLAFLLSIRHQQQQRQWFRQTRDTTY